MIPPPALQPVPTTCFTARRADSKTVSAFGGQNRWWDVGLYNLPKADCRHHLLARKLGGVGGGERQVVG